MAKELIENNQINGSLFQVKHTLKHHLGRHKQSWLRLSLGVIFGIGLAGWLLSTLEFRQIWAALSGANYVWVGLGLLTVLLNIATRGLRWHILLNSNHITISGTIRALILGQLLNLVFPARLGDLGRAYFITQVGYTSQAKALGTIALEKLWDIFMLMGLVVMISFWQALPLWIVVPARLTGLIGAILLIGIIIALYLRRKPTFIWVGINEQNRLRWPWVNWTAGRLLDGLEGLHRPQLMMIAGGWSLLAWFFGAMTNLMMLKAFNLPLSLGMAALLLVVLQLGVAVPSVPGQVGVFESLCLITLALFGIEANLAFGYALALHTVVLLPPIILGIAWIPGLNLESRQAILS